MINVYKIRYAIALLLISPICLSGKVLAQSEVKTIYANANAKLSEGDTLTAIAEFRKANVLNRNAGRSLAELANGEGFVKLLQKDYAGALEDFNTAIEQNAHHAVAYYNRALAENKLDMSKEAREDFAEAILLDPNYVAAYYSRGLARIEAGNYQGAAQDFTSVIEQKPNWVNAYYQRAYAYGKLKDYKRQVIDLDQIVKLKPQDVHSYVDRGLVKARQGRYTEAIDDYDMALGLEPTNHDARFHKNVAEEKLDNRRGTSKNLTSVNE
jgi:tetratricopeptide (TPR) repeat protein